MSTEDERQEAGSGEQKIEDPDDFNWSIGIDPRLLEDLAVLGDEDGVVLAGAATEAASVRVEPTQTVAPEAPDPYHGIIKENPLLFRALEGRDIVDLESCMKFWNVVMNEASRVDALLVLKGDLGIFERYMARYEQRIKEGRAITNEERIVYERNKDIEDRLKQFIAEQFPDQESSPAAREDLAGPSLMDLELGLKGLNPKQLEAFIDASRLQGNGERFQYLLEHGISSAQANQLLTFLSAGYKEGDMDWAVNYERERQEKERKKQGKGRGKRILPQLNIKIPRRDRGKATETGLQEIPLVDPKGAADSVEDPTEDEIETAYNRISYTDSNSVREFLKILEEHYSPDDAQRWLQGELDVIRLLISAGGNDKSDLEELRRMEVVLDGLLQEYPVYAFPTEGAGEVDPESVAVTGERLGVPTTAVDAPPPAQKTPEQIQKDAKNLFELYDTKRKENSDLTLGQFLKDQNLDLKGPEVIALLSAPMRIMSKTEGALKLDPGKFQKFLENLGMAGDEFPHDYYYTIYSKLYDEAHTPGDGNGGVPTPEEAPGGELDSAFAKAEKYAKRLEANLGISQLNEAAAAWRQERWKENIEKGVKWTIAVAAVFSILLGFALNVPWIWGSGFATIAGGGVLYGKGKTVDWWRGYSIKERKRMIAEGNIAENVVGLVKKMRDDGVWSLMTPQQQHSVINMLNSLKIKDTTSNLTAQAGVA